MNGIGLFLSSEAKGYWTFLWDLKVSWTIFGNHRFMPLVEWCILIQESQINTDINFRTVCGKTKWMVLASRICTWNMSQWREWGWLDKIQPLGRAGARDLCIMPSRPETGSQILIALTYKINTLQRKFTCCQIWCQGLGAHSSFKSLICFHFFLFSCSFSSPSCQSFLTF